MLFESKSQDDALFRFTIHAEAYIHSMGCFCCSFALCFEGHTYMRKNYQYWGKHPHTYIQHGKVMFVWFIYDTLDKEGNSLHTIYKEPL